MNMLHTKTVIIGAGISGISAGINFLKNGYDNFLILEANDRIGGRAFTIDYNGKFLELGAQYIHGQLGNPIYEIAINNKLISEEYKKITELELAKDLEKFSYSNEDGQELNKQSVFVLFNLLEKSIEIAKEAKYEKETFCRLGDFLYKNYINLIKENNLDDKFDQNLIDSIFKWRCKIENLQNSFSSVNEMSLSNFSKFENLQGYYEIELLNGYRSFINVLIKDYKESFLKNLKLNHHLNQILLCEKLDGSKEDCQHCLFTDDTNKIVLKINNETVVLCDQVICTMSLGYLKENISKLIKPSRFLPDEKLKVISRLGYGTVNKIFLIYEKPFWDENFEGINMIWSDKNKQLFNDLDHLNFDYKTRWMEDISIFVPSSIHNNILIGWIGGNVYHEDLDDKQVTQECNLILKKFLNKEDIPEPKEIIRTKWNSNPLFNGSYSFYAFGSERSDGISLSEPIVFNQRPFIQFAGEATHPKYFSTVHGAYLSGLRESERILKNT